MDNLGPYLGDSYYAALEYALTQVPPDKYALEFGVATGTTMRMIEKVMPVTGFDSFEGLPEDWRPGFEAGRFKQEPPKFQHGELVIGLFEDTLPKWIEENEDLLRLCLFLVHIDCDLYSSTKTILSNLKPFLSRGQIIVFDEYHGYPGWEDHEYKAWQELGMNYEVLGHGPEQAVMRLL